MKKRNDRHNLRTIVIASSAGAAIVAVTMAVAYNSAVKKLVPTGTKPYSSSVTYSTAADVPVQNTITGLPKEEDGLVTAAIPSEDNSSKGSEKANSSSKAENSESDIPVNKPVNTEMGNIMPVIGEVSHQFSNGELVKSETLGVWKTHDGCDILCDLGTDVKSMSEGIVKQTDNDAVWGVCVTVDQSNGLEVHYCGLDKDLNVKTGQQIKQGEIIGKTGDTNQAEILQQPHLHLGVKRGDNWIDPLSVINQTVE